jgi:GrpB-like predicted nucleotidyltransferase (UPF0157 family)
LTEPVELSDYDSNWPATFERERVLIAPILGANAIEIEHMGSTSIPGLRAKPIIDVIVLVDALAAARAAIPALEATGYSFWADNPDKTKLFLVKGLPPAPHRTHHLHIYENAEEVERHLAFRDRLRAQPELRDAYLALKTDLARRFRNDREAYTDHKADFINEVVRSATGTG